MRHDECRVTNHCRQSWSETSNDELLIVDHSCNSSVLVITSLLYILNPTFPSKSSLTLISKSDCYARFFDPRARLRVLHRPVKFFSRIFFDTVFDFDDLHRTQILFTIQLLLRSTMFLFTISRHEQHEKILNYHMI